MHHVQASGLSAAGIAAGEDMDSLTDSQWKEFFRDPSQWWDNRKSKRSARQPDFKHRLTKRPLWMNSISNPPWVREELIKLRLAADNGYAAAVNTAESFSPSSIWSCCKNKDLMRGIMIHNELQRRGLLDHRYSDALITMYAKCGELEKAQALLDTHSSGNVVTWTALIGGYARIGNGTKALDCFHQMRHIGIAPNDVTYVCVLKACAVSGALGEGKKVHDEIRSQGLLERHIVLGGALVEMYAKCGALQLAQSVLEKLRARDVVCWNSLIGGYANSKQGQQALDCFERMQRDGISPNEVTYVCMLKACATIQAIDKGKEIHDEIARQGLLAHHVVLGGALVDMYAKCGALCQAEGVLKKLPSRNVVSWGALIAGYTQNGQSQEALDCYAQMQNEGIFPNELAYVYILKACGSLGAIDKGRKLHEEILQREMLKHDVVLGGALVDMYAKCGALHQARCVLEKLPACDAGCWNALIAGYSQNREGQSALECFQQMQEEGIVPNEVTYVCILKACAALGAVDMGKKIHEDISRQGLLEHHTVLGGALIDMYAKCGALDLAQSALEKLPSRNVVSWGALIAGYSEHQQGRQALDCFEKMLGEGIIPNEVIYSCVLKACAAVRALDKGMEIHDAVARQGMLDCHVVLGGALVDMYAKCGALCQAQSVLEKLPARNVVCWNALITGYALNNQGQQALNCFDQMQSEGITPNEVTYACILKACALNELMEKGKKIHEEILRQGLLKEHVGLQVALVDMYAKCGALHQARNVLEKLPVRDVACWNALIAGYAQNGQSQQALECFEQMQHDCVLPDEVTYLCILKACGASGAIEKGKEIHEEILSCGLLEHHIVLGGALVDMYTKCGALNQARSVLEKLSDRNAVCWNALIAGYVQNGQGKEALECFQQMQDESIAPNEATFCCVLNLCSHFGLVEKSQELFDNMESRYGLKPSLESFICMVDLLGRSGHLLKAVEVIQGMPVATNSVIWHCLLGACQRWADVNVGIWAFEKALELDKCDGTAHVLMESIYSAAGMRKEAKHIEAKRIKLEAIR